MKYLLILLLLSGCATNFDIKQNRCRQLSELTKQKIDMDDDLDDLIKTSHYEYGLETGIRIGYWQGCMEYQMMREDQYDTK